jgi:Predicted nucleotide-binding protein containing TIR -like domain
MKPRVFIGSSTEGLPVAYALQSNLDGDAEVTVWEQNVFNPSEYILESLLKKLEATDFGIFVFSPDDLVRIRGQEQAAVRDNVIFEFGLFVGHLGRQYSVMLLPKGEQLRIPTDLWGVNVLTFDSNRKDGNLQAAVGPASNKIRMLLAALPFLKAETPEELEVPISERRDLLSAAQREILKAIEKSGECSREDLLQRFPRYSASELHYRLEQLRSFMFITVTDPVEARYTLGDSYRKAYNSKMVRIARTRPPPSPAPPRP